MKGVVITIPYNQPDDCDKILQSISKVWKIFEGEMLFTILPTTLPSNIL